MPGRRCRFATGHRSPATLPRRADTQVNRHVSFERLLSGPGLELIYRALAERAGTRAAKGLSAPEITRRALAGADAVCVETLDAFCAMLGTAAANLAVTLGALGGIYIGGGIVPRLGEYFDRSGFRKRFEDKGRFSDYLAQIPTWVITAENATFHGVSAILAAQLRNLSGGSASAILGQIQRVRPNLSPAERRVADHVLAHPRSVLNDPVAEIARASQVSQPTVIRFCRSLGCEGLSDFKLRLASGLTGTVPVTHTQVTRDDSVLELGTKVLGNTASSILQVRDHLNRDSIDRAIALLVKARRVDCFAVGYYGSVALDAQYKFLRLGLPSGVHVDPRVQALAAQVLGPGDVAFIVSPSGRKDELLAVADAARERGGRRAGHHRQPDPAGAQSRRGADRRPCGRRRPAPADGQPRAAPADGGHRHRRRGDAAPGTAGAAARQRARRAAPRATGAHGRAGGECGRALGQHHVAQPLNRRAFKAASSSPTARPPGQSRGSPPT